MKRFIFILLGVILVCSLVIMSCAPKEQAPQAPKVLKIGAVFPLTGPAAGYGQPTVAGCQLAVDKINADGGFKVGRDTYTLQLIPADDQFTSDGAKTAGEKLVSQDGVKFMFGAQETNDTLGLQLVTTPNKVITFNMAWADTVLRDPTTKKAIPYAFKMNLSPHELLRGIWAYIQKAYPDVKNVAEFGPNTDSGHYGTDLDSRLVKYLGYNVVYSGYHEYGLTDFYPQLTQILATKPDIIHSTSSGPSDWGLIMKQAREMGYKGQFMQEVDIGSQVLASIVGKEPIEGLITIDFLDQGPNASPELADFQKQYAAKIGVRIPGVCVVPSALGSLIGAMQKAGTVEDTDAIQKALETNTFNVMGQDVRFVGASYYGANRALAIPSLVCEVKDGELVPVASISVEDMVTPWPPGVE